MQRVPEFVKRGPHFILSEQCWFARRRLRNVEVIRDNRLRPEQIVLRDISIHPRASALGRPRVVVADENRQRFSIAIVNFEDADVRLIDRQIVAFLEREAVKLLRSEKDAVNDDVVQLVIRTHLRFVERIFRLAHFLRVKVPIRTPQF